MTIVPFQPAEEWRGVPEFPGYYVSNQGRVISTRSGAPRMLRSRASDGYRLVTVRQGGKPVSKSVHSLVMLAFVGPRPVGMDICHWDGDRANNSLENLRYGTRSENMADLTRHGRHHFTIRTHCPKGHPYDDENTYRRPDYNGRECRACHRAIDAARSARRRQERSTK